MKKIFTILLGASMAMSASALTLQDLTGNYELQKAYGSLWYIATAGETTFGINEGDTEANQQYINDIKVTTDGDYLYFSNFLGLTFYAEADLEAKTVTIPVQTITAPTDYSFTQCLMDSRMWAGEGETAPSFTDDDAQPIVLSITDDGDLTLLNSEGTWNYIAYWGWGANYGYITGDFHKTSSFVPDNSVKYLLGTHTCTEFNGYWYYVWAVGDDDDWHNFNITTGEGIEEIGVDPGTFEVTINSLGGLEVEVNGLWWGALSITGTYDPDTKTITFPLQSVWGGYTLCNSSICDIEVPTAADVVPATAVVNEDGTITMNYTVEYSNYPYLYATQTLAAAEQEESKLTLEDLTGVYNFDYTYGWCQYVIEDNSSDFGPDYPQNDKYVNDVHVTTDGEYLYFHNFLGFTFYAVADFESNTVTIPVQTITAPSGYSYTLCKWTQGATNDTAEPIVLTILDNGGLTTYNYTNSAYDYISLSYSGYFYAYFSGTFYKTTDLEPSEEIKPLIGEHLVTEFKGEWTYMWSTDPNDSEWHAFDIASDTGIDEIYGASHGLYSVDFASLGGNDLEVSGLWWGDLTVNGTYDPATKTITFPLQSVWGGYTFCNSSICEVEVPTAADVVPATAVVNEDGSITLNYTVEYDNFPYLYATQVLDGKTDGISSSIADTKDAPIEYYNLNGMRVNPTVSGIYIVRQGNKVSKQIIRK